MRKYRAQVLALEAELSEHRLRASKDKGKYADWNTELQQKLKELRDEKRKWALEAATLRSAEKEARVCSIFAPHLVVKTDRPRRFFMHKESCLPKLLRRCLIWRLDGRRTSTRLTGCVTMNDKLSST